MANRADRRKARQSMPRKMRMGAVQVGTAPMANIDDVRQAMYDEGFKDGVTSTYMAVYAGVCAAANELYGFGESRCFKLISRADEIVSMRLTNKDLCDDVFQRMGLRINYDETFDRVETIR